MQRTDLIRSKKWAMEDAFLREVGASLSGSTSMRSWNEPWEISTKNRDRPGGHMPSRYYRRWKKVDKRKARREHRKIIADAVREFYEDQEYWYDEFETLPYHQRYYDEWIYDQIKHEQMVMDWNDFLDEEYWKEFDKEMEDLYDFMYD